MFYDKLQQLLHIASKKYVTLQKEGAQFVKVSM